MTRALPADAQWFGLVASSTLALACTAPDAQPPSALRAAVTQGVPASEFPAVVALRDRTALCPSEPLPPFCSGQLLGPRAVVTSAHCVLGYQARALEILLGDNAREAAEALAVEAIRIHPEYDVTTRANDLAMLVLRTPASAAPLEIVPYAEDAGTVDAARIQLVGFGAEVVSGVPGQKRAGMTTVEEVTPSSLRVRGAPSLSCDGDSGGAAVAVSESRANTTLGVIRSGDSGCAEFTVIVRLTPYWDDFIEPILAESELPVRPREAALTCDAPCTTNESCQGGAVCVETEHGKRCSYSKLGPVEYRSACGSSADCLSNLCVSVTTGAGADACRCATPCGDVPESHGAPAPEPGAKASGGGCALVQRASGFSSLAALFGAALFLRARRRSRAFARCRERAARRGSRLTRDQPAKSFSPCVPDLYRPTTSGCRTWSRCDKLRA